ncbi:hypothetical protein [Pontibacter arcticus]|uniref:Uncharacterized protein n=1 Tax=Pontibacter arcticus TaxID=2080288 RepID=A0A364RB98_9BACT|nr:hypothetical protein [Pontibacter arcticus]RAU81620.1 hypothetical protein DP923_12940 [Pontibacter arcticus]
MIDTSSKLYNLSKILGIIFIICYWLSDSLFDAFWVLGLIPFAFIGTPLIIILLIAIFKKDNAALLVGLSIVVTILITEVFRSELLKSEKVLVATLDGDGSRIFLTLRENRKFELVADHMFGSKTFKGNYDIVGNKVIFLTRPYDNDFIPDTISIINDKLVLDFDSSGKPILGFANYFTIEDNKIKRTITTPIR